ncbi:MAG TPA: GxxExxY protein [Bryobacteraceae bacterium]|nr:GxxExxY protein [Bryobacteraceae bacterium]
MSTTVVLKSKPESAEGAEGTSAPRSVALDRLTEQIIGAAIEVHRNTGPGLMESVYEQCLCYELSQQLLKFERQVHLPISYKGIKLDCGYRMDLVVEDSVVIEIKTVDQLLPIHTAQLLTYLKLSNKPIGLILNFNSPILKKGMKRLVNHYREGSVALVPSAPSAGEPDKAVSTRKPIATPKTLRLGGEKIWR